MLKSTFPFRVIMLVLALFAGTNCLWAQVVLGKVIDAETGEEMPGVAIQYNQSRNLGVVTDMRGNFSITDRSAIQNIVFSFIGYQTVTFTKADIPKSGNWVIKMQQETEELNEVEVLAGENPALRIVRNAIENRNLNNPRKYSSYKYVSYNKNVITYKLAMNDSTTSKRDSALFTRDTISAKSRHMMVMESVTKKFYKAPNKAKENIIGSRISGFKNPSMGVTPDGIQNFAFHENIIPLVNKKYLNPIANGADKKYVYILKDTVYQGRDTIFIMDYFPEKGSNFEGFIGEIGIHTYKWALVHITAYPYDDGKVNLYVEQDYELVKGKYWFPVQMNFQLALEKVPLRNNGAIMIGRTHLDSIEIGLPIPDDVFNHIEVDFNTEASFVDDGFWEEYRSEELTEKETETYHHMDSLGDRYQFDFIMDAMTNFYDGFIVVKKIDVEFSKVLAYNQYEGMRLGLGLYTNDKISEKFRVGGYFGYGLKDKQWKFGGKFFWYFNKPNDFYLTLSYKRDVLDPGGIRLRYNEWNSIAQQFFNRLMDKVEETEITLTYRLGRYSKFKVGGRQLNLKPTYDYFFLGEPKPDNGQLQLFSFAEAQIWYRWQYKEKFSTNWGQRISYGSKYPIVNIIYSRGFSGVVNGQFDYNKLEVGISYERFTKNLGKTRLTLEAGIVDVALPWSMNFSGRPSYNPSFSVVVRETFQTMRFNEFSSTQYASLFFMHDFGPLLLRMGIIKPEIRIFQAMTFGRLDYQDMHEGIPFKDLEDGFFESGLVIDNIIRINLLNVGYLGLGAGAFYRYGANHFAHEADNWTFKLAFMYSVN